MRSFDARAERAWCELVKDAAALANSGGGKILVSLASPPDDPTSRARVETPKLELATLIDRVAFHTGVRFTGFHIEPLSEDGDADIVISVESAAMPLVIEKEGVYLNPAGGQVTAFNAGAIYVRHGAKSEPARSAEVARMVERQLRRARREWSAAVRKVVSSRPGTPPIADIVQSARPDAAPIRITADPHAPGYRLVDPDITHPWRQKEVLAELNATLPESDHINSFDILAVRRLHGVDDNAQFVHRAKFGATQYSPAFLTWLTEQYGRDHAFFIKAREAFKKLRNTRDG